tara:strand:+ start:1640 stop:1945 length:306 start_codon:yes stop_codon:yes gene_type:complete
MVRFGRIAGVPLNKDTMGSLTTALKDLAKGRFAHELVKKERLRICQTCPLGGIRCKACGCFIQTKASLQNSTCPLGKWSASNTSIDTTKHEETSEESSEHV